MGGFPALQIHTEGEPPLQMAAQAIQIKSGLQQVQAQQQAFQDREALTKAMSMWDGKDYNALPQLVTQAGGSGAARLAATNQILDVRAKASDIAKNDSITAQNTADTLAKQHDAYRGRIMNVIGIDDPAAQQAAWDKEVTAEEKAGTIQPGQYSHTYPGDSQALTLANSFALGSQLVKEQQERQKIALDAWKPAAGALQNVVTGEQIGGLNSAKIAQLNTALQARYQVLHPGEPLPEHFKLQPNATPADFANIDKVLEATERSTATVAQQQTTNAIRAQTFEMAREKTDMKAVIGTDPKTGQSILLPAGQAQQMGITNPMQASDDQVNKAIAARHWLTLASKPAPAGAPPDEMSITQLIDKLDASGDLGKVASRWNEFLAGKVGEGNPYVSALRTKMGLSETLLMQSHVGSKSSSAMLEHFQDLANQKKLDGPNLRASFNSEINYSRDKAMDPNPPDYSRGTSGKAGAGTQGISVTAPDGSVHTFRDQASADKFKKLAGMQ